MSDDTLDKKIDELCDYEGDEFTSWEIEFVESIARQHAAQMQPMSRKQLEVINRLLAKM